MLARRPRFDETSRTLRRLRRRAKATPRRVSGEVEINGYRVEYLDLLSLYMEYKDIFAAGIYHFESPRPNPRVIDGGGFIGLSVLYTKKTHPDARITCFEPDPMAHAVLRRNVEANRLREVELVQAGLAAEAGSASFLPDGADGGRLVENGGAAEVKTVRLSDYLEEPVDFLKLNIEGMELPVLEEAAKGLPHVRELVLEYHGWPGQPQGLGSILNLLDRCGFRYLINHFDYETNDALCPPFSLERNTRWIALVYGRRGDLL
jgi:FkbM family methyltransferase